MKYLSITAAAIAAVAIPTFAADNSTTRLTAQEQAAQRREARQGFEQLIRDINALDNQPAARRAGLVEAARQAGVTVTQLQSQPKDQQKAGLAGLFLAQEIAKNTKKSPQDLFEARIGGDTWTQIAQKNNQSLVALENKLTRIHEAMLATGGTPAATGVSTLPQTTPAQTAATAGAQPVLEQSIQSVNALGQETDARQLGLSAIARETALSRQQVEQAASQNNQIGLGDLFVAQQLALKGKKSVSEMWNAHLSPRSWADIARDNNVDATHLETQLARVESAMRGQTIDAQRVRARDERQNNSTVTTTTPNTPATPATFNETTFQQSIQSVNSLGQDAKVRSAGLNALSRETAIPLPQLEQAQQQNQGLGMGDLFVAQELSAKTKKSADELWKQHLNAKTWSDIARENNQDIAEIQRKLSRIEQTLRDAGK